MKIKTPFTDEQVEKLKQKQANQDGHPYTCCSPEDIDSCERVSGKSEGVLIPTNEGLICPCRAYIQCWCHL